MKLRGKDLVKFLLLEAWMSTDMEKVELASLWEASSMIHSEVSVICVLSYLCCLCVSKDLLDRM